MLGDARGVDAGAATDRHNDVKLVHLGFGGVGWGSGLKNTQWNAGAAAWNRGGDVQLVCWMECGDRVWVCGVPSGVWGFGARSGNVEG